MGDLLRFPDEAKIHSDGHWQSRLVASETVDSLIGLTNTFGACLAGLATSLRRLGEVSQRLDHLVEW